MEQKPPSLKVITWNVNSIGVRLPRLLNLLKREDPDIVCLQELKCLEEKFPKEALQNAGYYSTVLGQKTYNGVAVLSKEKPDAVWLGMNEGEEDPAARVVGAKVCGITAFSIYVPNGQEVGSDKYAYKLLWLSRFRKFLDKHFSSKELLLVAGDYNIAPEDKDVYDATLWDGKILFSNAEKEGLKNILNFGLKDTFRMHHPEPGNYSWWDYRQGAFHRNFGLRIDFILATQGLSELSLDSFIDREERKGEKPSDHAPVIAIFKRV